MTRTLKEIYDEHVKMDKAVTVVYKKVLDVVLKNVIDNMKQENSTFDELYSHIYYTGSFYDGLKVGSSEQEFDLNIVFNVRRSHVDIVDLGIETKKPNFGFLSFNKSYPSEAEKSICFERDGELYLSPKKMFQLIETSGDRALTNLIEGHEFKITRTIGAPYTLKVSGTLEGMPVKCDIDLVPSIELDIDDLPKDGSNSVFDRVHDIKEEFPCPQKEFMAISLWRADSCKFELDFHNIERGILYNEDCVKTVVKLIKYLRDVKGGSFFKLSSHLIKTVVMHQVIKNKADKDYWNEKNLERCFIGSLTALYNGLDARIISDVFFPTFNMLTSIKQRQVIEDTKQWLFRSLRMYHETGDATKTFESGKSHQFSVCPICYKVFNENDNQVDNEKRMRQHMNSKKNDRDHMPDPKIRDIACPICKDERFGASDSAVAHVESGACPGCKGKSRARQTVYNFVHTKGLEGMLAHPPRIKSSSSKNVTVPDFPYKCSICKKSFAEVCSLMQHQKHKHGNPGKKSLKALQK